MTRVAFNSFVGNANAFLKCQDEILFIESVIHTEINNNTVGLSV